MNDPLDRLLEVRRQRDGGRPLVGLVVSTALHGLLLVIALFVAPRLFAEPPRPIDYVPVTLVPPPALGVEQPAPRPAPPKPAPEPVPQPPAPAPPPAPALPSAERKPPPEPAPREEPPPPGPVPEPVVEQPTEAAPAAPPQPALPGRPGSPTGDPTSPLTQSTAVAGIDNPDFTYGYYLDRMLALIRGSWVRPPLGSGVEAVVHFRILEDGRVEELRIVQSSGYNSFDLAALRAVQSAAPLPPLPRSYKEGRLGVNLIFR
ncbi:MAG TPA: energy transducer TonB [Thermoanaerobaculia bacterium]|nr:energy transducer TonB [Thermoanaerobaculia bacterium]